MDDRLLLLIVYMIGGILLCVLALPLLWGRVKPNWIYGFRIPQTLNDEKVWYAVNGYGARWLLAAGASFLAAAVGLYFVESLSLDAYALITTAVFFLVSGFGLWRTWRFMRAL